MPEQEIPEGGWIVAADFRRPTPNLHRAPNVLPIEFVVYHYTAGGLKPSIFHLCDPAAQVSAHFVIDRDGSIYQLASILDRTWHAGGTAAKPSAWLGRGRVNDRSIGIEIVNWGPLGVSATGMYHPIDMPSLVIPGPVVADPMNTFAQYWEPYPEAQIAAVEALTRQLVSFFPVLSEGPERLTGHEHVDSGRKHDPGPVFDWARIRAAAAPAPSSPAPDAPAGCNLPG